MKRITSVLLCMLLLVGLALPVQAANDVPEAVMESTKSVVRILSTYRSSASTGSGFVIKNEPGETLVVTNDHVVEGNPSSISIWVGENKMVDAQIVFTVSSKDLCVLRVTENVDMKPLKLSREEPRHGAAIYVVGYPGAGDILSDTTAHTSDSATITDGIISAIRTFTIESGQSPVKLLQINAAVNSGNSGGPLFDENGVVVGVNTYKVNANSQGVFGAVAVSELLDLLEQHDIELPQVATAAPSFRLEWGIVGAAVCVVLVMVLVLRRKKIKAGVKTEKKEKTSTEVTLKAYLENHPYGLGEGGAVSLLLPCAVQLRNLHNDGKLHLQICPENVLVGGASTTLKAPSVQETDRFHSGFAAPEIYKGAGYGVTSDVYSFAALLLFAATGKTPANSLQQDMLAQDLDAVGEKAFADVLRKAMAFTSQDRYQSMQELVYSIAVFQGQTAAAPNRPAEVPQVVETPKPVEASKIEEEKKSEPVKVQPEPEKTPQPIPAKPKKRRNRWIPITAVLVCAVAVAIWLAKPEAVLENIGIETTETTEDPWAAAYAEAEELLDNGEIAKAAIAFYKMGDYADARQRSFEIWGSITNQNVICTAYDSINKADYLLGVKQDGTVIASQLSGSVENPLDLSDWTDVVSIYNVGGFLLGLRSDGTILYTRLDKEPNNVLPEVIVWQDIVWMDHVFNTYYKNSYVIGLKADGTIVTAGTSPNFDLSALSDWSDIARIYMGGFRNSYIFGLKTDGTVVHIGELSDHYSQKTIDTSGWTNIVDIQAGNLNIVGLRADGTVVATGDNGHGQCNVSHWTDIVEIGIGNGNSNGKYTLGLYTVGLKSDGTVVVAGYAGDKNDLDSVAQWTDVKTISAATRHVLGLRSDGTVVAAGMNRRNLNVSSWTDVEQIWTEFYYSAGLRSDGTVVQAGQTINTSVVDWKNIDYLVSSPYRAYGWCSDGIMRYELRGQTHVLAGWTNMKMPNTPKRPVSFSTK